MLYDNSQPTRVYHQAWQVTSSEFSRAITEEILDDGYRPFQVVALGTPDGQRSAHGDVQLARLRQLPSNAGDRVVRIAAVPLLQDRGLVDEQVAAYVCRYFTCQAPVTKVEGLRAQLEPD